MGAFCWVFDVPLLLSFDEWRPMVTSLVSTASCSSCHGVTQGTHVQISGEREPIHAMCMHTVLSKPARPCIRTWPSCMLPQLQQTATRGHARQPGRCMSVVLTSC